MLKFVRYIAVFVYIYNSYCFVFVYPGLQTYILNMSVDRKTISSKGFEITPNHITITHGIPSTSLFSASIRVPHA